LCGISQARSECVRRTWIPTTSLLTHPAPYLTSTTCWQKSSPKRSSFRGDQLRLHEVVESFLKITPGATETARGNDSFEQMRIECAEPWSENAAVGLGEQHGDSAAKVCQLITIGVWDFGDEFFAFQAPQIVCRLPTGIR